MHNGIQGYLFYKGLEVVYGVLRGFELLLFSTLKVILSMTFTSIISKTYVKAARRRTFSFIFNAHFCFF